MGIIDINKHLISFTLLLRWFSTMPDEVALMMVSVVIVESLSTFLAQPPRVHHPFEQDTGSVFRIRSSLIQGLLNG